MMLLYLKSILLLVFKVIYSQTNFAEEFPKGHLMPLGSHRAPDKIEERYDIPTPLEFWNKYVKVSRPVVFRGAATFSKAFDLWTDKYLKEKYGNLEVRLEKKAEKSGRVLIGAKGLGRDSIANFIDTYHNTNNYIVSELPTPMWDDISVQPCLTCGTFAHRLVEIDLWMSGGGSKSLLHKDAFNAINCLYNGTKEWKMIEYKYEKMIYKAWEPEYEIGGFSLLDVDAVDLIKYPKVIDVPWSFVTVHAGDCIFLPKSYYHQVNSYGSNNIAVAILFSRLDDLKEYNNTGCESETLSYVSLSKLDVDWKFPGFGSMTMGNAHVETARKTLKEALKRGPLTLESIPFFLKDTLHWKFDRESVAQKIFNILSKDRQSHVTEENIDSLTREDLRQLLLLIERYEPSNMYTYEYSYVRSEDIRLLLDTFIKQDNGVMLEKFVKAYQEHLGGTEKFALQIFKGFMSKNENMATADEVEANLDAVLKPYIEYRKKAGLDEEVSNDEEDTNDDDKDHIDDNDSYNDVTDNDDSNDSLRDDDNDNYNDSTNNDDHNDSMRDDNNDNGYENIDSNNLKMEDQQTDSIKYDL